MSQYRVFIVEDDPWYGELLEYHLSLNPDYELFRYTSGQECLANLHRKPHVITLDYSLGDMTGKDVLQQIKKQHSQAEVVVISGQEDISTAVEMLKLGAYDYIVKDDDTRNKVFNTVARACEKLALVAEVEQLREEVGRKYEFATTIRGNSPSLKEVFALISKAASTNINVTITGETGTGKDLVAKAVHYNSERKTKKYVPINMAAIPRELVESELFGYEKGSFTGANARKIGKFEEANKGTLFLDEIAEMDLNIQSKLLRVLQERELTRVGGSEVVKLDIRLIVATHKDLAEEVKKGNFRQDLYYRILGLPIHLPPLRERGNDILLLAKHFCDEFCKENSMKPVQLSPGARDKLMRYGYPGNVRELKSVMDLACVLADNGEIREENIRFSHMDGGADFLLTEMTLRSHVHAILKHYLKKYDDDVLLVAQKLDIGKSTIYNMIKEMKQPQTP